MRREAKITTGPNDRPRNETIGQTGQGLPDDSSRPVEVDESAVARVREQLLGPGGAKRSAAAQKNPEAVPSGTPGAGENACRRCSGTGKVGAGLCPECGGTGKVTTPVGGA